MLLVRRTYQELAAVWPQRTTTECGSVAHARNNMPPYAVSTTLGSVDWQHSTVSKGSPVAELTRLKQQPDKNIAVKGSAILVQSLLRMGMLTRCVSLSAGAFSERGSAIARVRVSRCH
jgi:dihydrofolate reductase